MAVLSRPVLSPGVPIVSVPGVVATLDLGYQPINKAITERKYNVNTIGIVFGTNPTATLTTGIGIAKQTTKKKAPVKGNGIGAQPNAVASQTLYTSYPGMPTGRTKKGV